MVEQTSQTSLLWPLVLYGIAVLLLVGGMLSVAYILGERHREIDTDAVYESGIEPTGSTKLRFPVHFYIVAMFFVIFDVAAVFIIAWAVSIREVGWAGYTAVLIFIGILVSILLYVWKIGALNFGPDGKKILKAYYKKIEKDRN